MLQEKNNILNKNSKFLQSFSSLTGANGSQYRLEHGLSGLKLFTSDEQKKSYKNNTIINLFLKKQFKFLQEKLAFNGVSRFIPLKGMSLIDRVYTDIGERRLTDIDVLINEKDLPRIRHLLTNNSFTEKKDDRWAANKHKYIFIQNSSLLDIEIELHTSLFAHSALYNYEENLNGNELDLELEFLYMCFHLAEQHNFLKLKWLYDLYKFYEVYKKSICILKLQNLAETLKVESSLLSCVFCLNTYFAANINLTKTLSAKVQKILSVEFLIQPKRRSISYIYLKFYLKSSRSTSYFLSWFINKIRSYFTFFEKKRINVFNK